jgi:hypothetical protein
MNLNRCRGTRRVRSASSNCRSVMLSARIPFFDPEVARLRRVARTPALIQNVNFADLID